MMCGAMNEKQIIPYARAGSLGRARYLSVTESLHNTESIRVGEEGTGEK